MKKNRTKTGIAEVLVIGVAIALGTLFGFLGVIIAIGMLIAAAVLITMNKRKKTSK